MKVEAEKVKNEIENLAEKQQRMIDFKDQVNTF